MPSGSSLVDSVPNRAIYRHVVPLAQVQENAPIHSNPCKVKTGEWL